MKILYQLQLDKAKNQNNGKDSTENYNKNVQVELTPNQLNYLQQLKKFDKLQWLIEQNLYKTGDCFGQILDGAIIDRDEE